MNSEKSTRDIGAFIVDTYDDLVYGAKVLGFGLTLGGIATIIAVNHKPLPTNEIYDQAKLLEEQIAATKEYVEHSPFFRNSTLQIKQFYHNVIQEKKKILAGLVITEEYNEVVRAKEQREGINDLTNKLFGIGTSALLITYSIGRSTSKKEEDE